MLRTIYQFLSDRDARTLYDNGGKFDEYGKIVIDLERRRLGDRKIFLTLWMDSHGLQHHHFPPAMQYYFKNQNGYYITSTISIKSCNLKVSFVEYQLEFFHEHQIFLHNHKGLKYLCPSKLRWMSGFPLFFISKSIAFIWPSRFRKIKLSWPVWREFF